MTQESGTARLTVPVSQRDHQQGPATAPVTLVEYGDYECPYCWEAYPIVKEIQRRLGDRMHKRGLKVVKRAVGPANRLLSVGWSTTHAASFPDASVGVDCCPKTAAKLAGTAATVQLTNSHGPVG